ncbi:MAG TPA: tetratricopeptide repeat protein, partial [Thermoanaerobaculaceae bacterium]|nr:tetratricopeptide repeat protein [Thermoanaerobaculaceae bacterium]
LGCGPGGYGDAAVARNFPREGEFARYARIPDLPESDVLAAAACLGAPGGALVAGLLLSVAGRLRGGGAAGWGVLTAIVATSAVNSQAMVAGVTWTAALALGGVLPRGRGMRRAGAHAAEWAVAGALSVLAAAVLVLPEWGAGPDPERAVAGAEHTLRAHPLDDAALADAEARAALACAARPRFARGWRILGHVRLTRAGVRNEEALAVAASEAYARCREVDPLDEWAAVGEARARRALGDRRGALRALGAAVLLEPNSAPAWLELASLHLDAGEVEAARAALLTAEDIVRHAHGVSFVTDYERELARFDPSAAARVRAAVGGAR